MMPAMKSLMMLSLIDTPYTISVSEGGIIRPKVAAPASVPTIIYSG